MGGGVGIGQIGTEVGACACVEVGSRAARGAVTEIAAGTSNTICITHLAISPIDNNLSTRAIIDTSRPSKQIPTKTANTGARSNNTTSTRRCTYTTLIYIRIVSCRTSGITVRIEKIGVVETGET